MTKVLVIEDDERTRRLYRVGLAFQGIKVTTAANTASGFKQFLETNPDLVILDIMLPGTGGEEFLKKIKDHGKDHTLPVIIVSDLKDESIRKEASILGACEYLVKSEHSIGDIITRVRKILDIEEGQAPVAKK
jgi:two-component system response regulator RegX3